MGKVRGGSISYGISHQKQPCMLIYKVSLSQQKCTYTLQVFYRTSMQYHQRSNDFYFISLNTKCGQQTHKCLSLNIFVEKLTIIPFKILSLFLNIYPIILVMSRSSYISTLSCLHCVAASMSQINSKLLPFVIIFTLEKSPKSQKQLHRVGIK